MQRVKVELPINFNFSTIIPIRITDMNYGGHVGNDSFLSLIHEARMQYLQHFGYTEINFENTSLIMADAAIEFKHEIIYTNTIKISVQAAAFTKIGFDLYYLLEIINGEELLIAGKAKTGMLCFDYTNKKITTVPTKVISKLTTQ